MSRNQSYHHKKSQTPFLWMIVIIVLTMTIVATFGGASWGNTRGESIASIDFTANDFTTQAPVHLSDFRGKFVFVNLWASWCGPCRAEIPDLIKFYNAQRAKELVFLAVDTGDQYTPASQFIREQPMPFIILFDPGSTVMQKLGANGLPASYLIDPSGKAKFSWVGQISPAILEQRVAPLLAQ